MASKINPIENGPLHLQADVDQFSDMKLGNTAIEIAKDTYLCRCGASKNKPYCDGSHTAAGFTSDPEISEEILQNYSGEQITVIFNRSICAGAAACVRGLPQVFKSGSSEEWIHPDNASVEQVLDTIHQCPSGALSYQVNHPVTSPPSDPEIRIVENGPYLISGEVEISNTPQPTRAKTDKCALCRCGLSKNKPFCDYSHAEQGWQDSEG